MRLQLALIGCLLAAPALPAAGGDETLPQLIQRLDAAIAKGDAKLAQAQFTATAWTRANDPGQALYQQGVAKHFRLRLSHHELRGERAVLTAEVRSTDRVVYPMYFYLVRQAGRWQIDGADESENHPAAFLAGHLPAAFRVEELPQSPQVRQLCELLVAAAEKKGEERERLNAQLVDTSSSGYLHLTSLRGATCQAAYLLEPLQRAALVFALPDPPPAQMVLYVRRQQAQWHLFGRSFKGPSAAGLLDEPKFNLKPPAAATP